MFEIRSIATRKKVLKEIPISSGCYIFRDVNHKVLYVGKAKSLKKRLSSYFSSPLSKHDVKICAMLRRARFLEVKLTKTEEEALILETLLIKKYRPKYNKLMKDDKNYIWVKFDSSKPFYKPEIVREKLADGAIYYGPYPRAFPAKMIINELRKIFPFCNTTFRYKKVKNDSYIGVEERPCLDYHLGLCNGECAGLASLKEHSQNLVNIESYFKRESKTLLKNLQDEMKQATKNLDFEKAMVLKKKIDNLIYISKKINIQRLLKIKDYSQDIYLKNFLKYTGIRFLENKNYRVECYDISNISGKFAVGSMVVAINFKIRKDQYRRFRIKKLDTPNDFLMMKEVLLRRLNYLKDDKKKVESLSNFPDIIIVDGGKGQMSLAFQALHKHNLHKKIKLLGLAKKQERLFKIKKSFEDKIIEFESIHAKDLGQETLFFVQRIRDEAHRFAITYHKNLRSRNFLKSVLSKTEGIGVVLERRLYEHFGDFESIKRASLEDLCVVLKNKATAKRLFDNLHGGQKEVCEFSTRLKPRSN